MVLSLILMVNLGRVIALVAIVALLSRSDLRTGMTVHKAFATNGAPSAMFGGHDKYSKF